MYRCALLLNKIKYYQTNCVITNNEYPVHYCIVLPGSQTDEIKKCMIVKKSFHQGTFRFFLFSQSRIKSMKILLVDFRSTLQLIPVDIWILQ